MDNSNLVSETVIPCRSPLAGWVGGKHKLASSILKKIPAHTCYVEPFCGAAWVLLKKPESKVEVLNDINNEIITLFRCIQYHLDEFVRYFRWALVSRDEFERLKAVNADTLTDIQRAARFYYLHQACFGGKIVSPSFGVNVTRSSRLNLLRIEETLSAVHLRLSRVTMECLPYREVITRYDNPKTFFYIDPPYWNCERDYGPGIFAKDDFANLAEQLATIKGNFILSLNDTPDIRRIFSGFGMEPIQTKYTLGNTNDKTGTELLIYPKK